MGVVEDYLKDIADEYNRRKEAEEQEQRERGPVDSRAITPMKLEASNDGCGVFTVWRRGWHDG